MLNVLNSGEQHNIATTLMVRVQLFCGVGGIVFSMAKSFVVCQVTGYVSGTWGSPCTCKDRGLFATLELFEVILIVDSSHM
jgi:hypothetical protein